MCDDNKNESDSTFNRLDGSKYNGEFVDGVSSGKGSLFMPDGAIYEGDFKYNKFNGIGTFTWPDGKQYIGEFMDDMFQGQGTETWPDGRIYVGEFDYGRIDGKGTLTMPDGQKYVGSFHDEKFHGFGNLTWSDGKNYSGEFQNGNMEGKGTFTWTNGQFYVGNFKDNKFCGKGELSYSNGVKFSAIFKGLKTAIGYLKYPDGKSFIGILLDGKLSKLPLKEESFSDLTTDNRERPFLPFYLFFDVNTNGLPKNWGTSIYDLENWPRLIQLAFIICDKDGAILLEENCIIKPDGFTIGSDVEELTGITNEKAHKEGKSINSVLEQFSLLLDFSQHIITHNANFVFKAIDHEFLRYKIKTNVDMERQICLMLSTTKFCAIPAPRGYKWPKLSELYQKLFNVELDDVHNAVAKVKAINKSFWELKLMGVL